MSGDERVAREVRAVRDHYRRVGWEHGSIGASASLGQPIDAQCLLDTLCVQGASGATKRAIEREVGGNIPNWNDRGSRTHQQVIDMLERVLTAQEPEGVMPQTPTQEPTQEPTHEPTQEPTRPGRQLGGAAPPRGRPRRPNATTEQGPRGQRPGRRREPCVRAVSGGEASLPAVRAKAPVREAAEWTAALMLSLAGAAAVAGLVAHLAFVLTVLGALGACSAVAAVVAFAQTREAPTRPLSAGTPDAEVAAPATEAWRRRWLGVGVRQREKMRS